MTSEKKLIPKKRFKGFEEEWESIELGKSVDYVKGFAFKSKYYQKSGVRIIRVSDLKTDKIINNNESIYIDKRYKKMYSSYKLNIDDIIITTVGSKAELKESAVGRPIKVTRNDDGLLNQNLVKICPLNKFNSYFIYVNLLKNEYRNYVSSIERGNANQANIAIENLFKYTLNICNIREQEKIGEFFKVLDERIANQERKIAKIKSLKSAYLTEMFPQSGETTPKRRFKGFEDEWEKKLLSEISDVRDGTHESPQYHSEGYLFITSKNISNGYINFDDINYISEKDFYEINKRSKVEVNDILMGMIGTIGNLALIKEKPNFAIKNVALIKNTRRIEPTYLYYFLQTSIINHQLTSGLDGGTQKFISLLKIRNLIILQPKKNEQRKIGEFFKNIDDQIATEEAKLAKLKATKTAYLEEMFV